MYALTASHRWCTHYGNSWDNGDNMKFLFILRASMLKKNNFFVGFYFFQRGGRHFPMGAHGYNVSVYTRMHSW